MTDAILLPHPTTPVAGIERLTAQARVSNDGLLAFRYTVEGELAGVRLPAPRPPGRADDLWRSTCFEAFLAGRDQAGYYEFNFAPSREWAVYRFSGYRAGMTPAEPIQPPTVTFRVGPNVLRLEAAVRLSAQVMAALGADLRVGLSAVIADRDGQVSYWALRHPPGPPDFHHVDGFALPLIDFQVLPDANH